MAMAKPCLDLLRGGAPGVPPIWLMRQAGRYLPEYRAVRARVKDFLELCYTPDLAAEVTFQPIRRYGFDAAILFADILLVPHSLGQDLRFVEGEGPRLDPIDGPDKLAALSTARSAEVLAPVMETVRILRAGLPPETTLIGFAGAPWTVATYMVAGRGGEDQVPARILAYREPALFGRLIDLIVEATIAYLRGQIDAGAEVIQIFDTWAGNLPDAPFADWVVKPTARIVSALRESHPGVPVIGFARGAGPRHGAYAQATGLGAISVETQMPVSEMARLADGGLVVQGNLDPMVLVAGGSALDAAIDALVLGLKGRRHIFNLGHGIVPQTPPENVARLIERVRRERV